MTKALHRGLHEICLSKSHKTDFDNRDKAFDDSWDKQEWEERSGRHKKGSWSGSLDGGKPVLKSGHFVGFRPDPAEEYQCKELAAKLGALFRGQLAAEAGGRVGMSEGNFGCRSAELIEWNE